MERPGRRAPLFFAASFVTTAWLTARLAGAHWPRRRAASSPPSAPCWPATQPGEEGSVYGIDNSIVAAARAAARWWVSPSTFWFDLRATFVAAAVIFLLVALILFAPARRTPTRCSPPAIKQITEISLKNEG
ncbi:MAG: hypothetical protein R3D55_06630 [Chloroflexota bacterium]